MYACLVSWGIEIGKVQLDPVLLGVLTWLSPLRLNLYSDTPEESRCSVLETGVIIIAITFHFVLFPLPFSFSTPRAL